MFKDLRVAALTRHHDTELGMVFSCVDATYGSGNNFGYDFWWCLGGDDRDFGYSGEVVVILAVLVRWWLCWW